MHRLTGPLHKIIPGIWLKVPIIYLPDYAGKSSIQFPKHDTPGLIKLMARGFENGPVSAGIQQLHFDGEILQTSRRSITIDHSLVVGIVFPIPGAGIMITPGIVKRIRKIAIRNQIGNDFDECVIRRLRGQSRFVFKNPIPACINQFKILSIILPGIRTATINS